MLALALFPSSLGMRLILDSLVSAHLMSQTWTNESTAHEARRLGSVNDQLKSLGVYVCVCWGGGGRIGKQAPTLQVLTIQIRCRGEGGRRKVKVRGEIETRFLYMYLTGLVCALMEQSRGCRSTFTFQTSTFCWLCKRERERGRENGNSYRWNLGLLCLVPILQLHTGASIWCCYISCICSSTYSFAQPT